jgi:Domain of unknown function (DUF6398)
MKKTDRVPEPMRDKFASLSAKTDAFCKQYLNDEYAQLCRSLIAALCRKRPSPLSKGKEEVWAAGIIQALGTVNFLFDKSQDLYCSSANIAGFFNVGMSTAQGKSSLIRDMFDMSHFSVEWMLPSKMDDNPIVWMLTVNGFIMDIRDAPVEAQIVAYEKGLIPYVPALREAEKQTV